MSDVSVNDRVDGKLDECLFCSGDSFSVLKEKYHGLGVLYLKVDCDGCGAVFTIELKAVFTEVDSVPPDYETD